jgi:S1-C subfamily serine protease
MKKHVRSFALVGLMALSGATVTGFEPPVAQAQGSLEYCEDLGVLVQHVGGGMVIRAMRGRATARQLGLRPGDLIFAVNGSHPDSIADLHRALFTGADEEDHDLDILRGNAHLHAAVFHSHGQIFVHTALH